MVVPLIAAGARIAGKRAVAQTAARRGAKGGVQNATRHTASASPRTSGTYARTGRTVPQPFEDNFDAQSGVQNVVRHKSERTARASDVQARQSQSARHVVPRILKQRQNVRALRSRMPKIKLTAGSDDKNLAGALRASWLICLWILPLFAVQLFFALISLAGFGFEYAGEQVLWGLGAVLIPGQTIFAVSHFAAVLVGILSFLAAGFVYSFHGVRWVHDERQLWFAVFLAFSIAPFLTCVPWLAIWMFMVVRAEK